MDQKNPKSLQAIKSAAKDPAAGKTAKSLLRQDKHLNKAYPLSEGDEPALSKINVTNQESGE